MTEWLEVTLGEVCDFKRGLTYSKKDEVETSSNAVFRANNIDLTTNKILLEEIRYISDTIQIPPDKKIRKNDILICTASGSKSHLGKVAIAPSDIDMAYGGFMGAIRSKDKIHPQYLFNILISPAFKAHIMALSSGANINNLTFKQIESFKVPLPPLSVQKPIVAKLDAAFASIGQAIAAAERNAENANQLFQSYLSDVFECGGEGWVDKHLNDVAVEFARGKSKHRPRNDPALYGGNYPFLQTGDVRNAGKFVTEYSQTYNEDGLKQSKLWQKGTLCITIAANIAEVGILGLDACFPDSIIGLVVDAKQADIEFIYYSLLFAQKILKAKGKGSAQDNINQGTFESMMFKFPDLNTQKTVVENLHSIAVVLEELNIMYSRKNELLTQLKQSLLQQAFNGQLVDA